MYLFVSLTYSVSYIDGENACGVREHEQSSLQASAPLQQLSKNDAPIFRTAETTYQTCTKKSILCSQAQNLDCRGCGLDLGVVFCNGVAFPYDAFTDCYAVYTDRLIRSHSNTQLQDGLYSKHRAE